MLVGVLVAAGGVGLWFAELVGPGWLLICLGGAITGFFADGDGFRLTGLAVLPLVGLASVGALGYVAIETTPTSAMDVTAVTFVAFVLVQLLLLLVTPFILAGGVGGWLRKQVGARLGDGHAG